MARKSVFDVDNLPNVTLSPQNVTCILNFKIAKLFNFALNKKIKCSMKTFLFSITLLWVTCTAGKALPFNNDYKIINLTISYVVENEREIPKDDQILTTRPRSVVPQPAYASIYNKVITLEFTESFSSANVIISNKITGEVIYSETSNTLDYLSIDLNGESSGEYLIKIEADDILLEGVFSL